MSQLRVALVCDDDALRMRAARAFDAAPADWEVTLHRAPPKHADVVVAVGGHVQGAVSLDLDAPETVVSDVHRAIVCRDRKLVTVVGASGGCGATSVALHLAAATDRSACVVEAGEPRLAVRLGLDPSLVGPAAVPVPGGFKIATLPDVPILDDCEVFEGFEAVLVDAPAPLLGSLSTDDGVCVLVMSPTVPAAWRAVEILESWPSRRWAVVTNRVGPGGETNPSDLQHILGRRLSLELPICRGLRDAEGESRLLSGWSLWRYRIERLARALELR